MVDFVLVYEYLVNKPTQPFSRRGIFLENLIAEGLEIEEDIQTVHNKQLGFIKIRASFDLLCRYAEILKFNVPIKKVRERQ